VPRPVVVDDVVHFCASDRSRKARNIAADPRCVITTTSDTLDLVVQGEATIVSDKATVRRVTAAYAAKYQWHAEVHEGAPWADGAPTAGPPPYRVPRLIPVTAFGFPRDETIVPTRWRF
jgi:hypothetical protein